LKIITGKILTEEPMRENIFHFVKEFIWLVLTVMVVYAILHPVTSKLDYFYWKINAVFIFVSFTYFRWSITLRSLTFLHSSVLRFALFTFNIPLFFYLMYSLQKIMLKLDNFFTEDLGFPRVILFEDMKTELFKYLNTEVVLFGTASLVLILAFQVRLIISYWQLYKHEASRMLED